MSGSMRPQSKELPRAKQPSLRPGPQDSEPLDAWRLWCPGPKKKGHPQVTVARLEAKAMVALG
eukprot:2336073-Alexandrium_andersonii.AAC.1